MFCDVHSHLFYILLLRILNEIFVSCSSAQTTQEKVDNLKNDENFSTTFGIIILSNFNEPKLSYENMKHGEPKSISQL